MNEQTATAIANDTPEQVKTLPGHFPLDWQTTKVRLGEGRFEHTLRRPTVEELLERDKQLQSNVEIGKDGAYKLPDPAIDEDTDAAAYDKVAIATQGYPGEVPAMHKAAAFRGMYRRIIEVDEDCSPFDELITVNEEIGDGDEPDFVISHVLRQPTEEELRLYRRKMQTGEIKPGKRGRQTFVTRSTLRTAVEFYDKWISSIAGGTVGGETWTGSFAADDFISAVDPLIKRMVVQALYAKISEALLD